MLNNKRQIIQGFTLIELILVIVVLGVLASFALPKFFNLTESSRVSVINGVAGSMRSAAAIVKTRALVNGLTPASSNPGGSAQTGYLVTTEAGTSEVDWRNLCPESRAELGDTLIMADHIGLELAKDLTVITDNQYTRVGYDIQNAAPPYTSGCYVVYDSFGDPECTVTTITLDC